jgi:DNA-binding beta-propeller fold protein YncE
VDTGLLPLRIFPHAKSADLLYISDPGANSVDYYTYPQGKLKGKLTRFGSVAGLCADKAGNVFVVDEAGPVQMFAHGGTSPKRKLTTSGAPYGCAVDPVTGDLAVTQLSVYSYGAIAIYPKAKGTPRIVQDKTVDVTWFCGYDDKGNLFIDAWDRYAKNELLKLAKGGKAFKKFYLPKNFQNPGGVQWDGKYVAVSNRGAGTILRMTENGGVAASIKLKDGADVEQFWIAGKTIVGPNDTVSGTVPFWHYPGGGAPTKTLSGFYGPFGAAVSIGQ